MVHWGSEDCVPPLPQDDTDAAWRGHLIDWAGVVGLSSVKEDNVEEWMWRLEFSSNVELITSHDGPFTCRSMSVTSSGRSSMSSMKT